MDVSRSRWRIWAPRWGTLSMEIPFSLLLTCKISSVGQWRAVCWHAACLGAVRAGVPANVGYGIDYFCFLFWDVVSGSYVFSPAGRTPRCRFIEKVPLATEKDVKYLPPFPFLSHFLILYFFILVLYNSLKLCFFLHRNCRINFLSSLQLVVGLCLCLLSPPSSDCTHFQLKLLDKTVVKNTVKM